ncbi:MAG TPA: Gfo/Idh/MocA family oxidoreductase [Pirellulales bacterium]|jgi:predicted dehydrogenase|nr:Gfo/Idh/MocA family oxidoreductase [Pirellulales bacterium]
MSSRVPHAVSRRRFLKASSAAVGAIAIPYFVPQRAFGANDRPLAGFIGVRNQGTANLKLFADYAAALCDVDEKVLGEAVTLAGKLGANVTTYHDYRKLLENKDLDVIVITTPDHWHARQMIDACAAGKHVYCEKPLGLTIAEGRKMVDAARKYNRVVQTGSQQRSYDNFRFACQQVRSGAIGKVREVHVGIPKVNFKGPAVADSSPPPELDYEFWLGPAPDRPYNVNRVHYNFRFFWDYSGGQMTNFGAHHIDIGQWGLAADDTGPIEIEGTAEYHPEHWYEVPMRSRTTLRYANGVVMTVGQDQEDIKGGTRFIGTDGEIHVERGKLSGTPDEVKKYVLNKKDDGRATHRDNFLACIRSGERPTCDVEIGHRSATVCHLANNALRLGRKIQWDPQAEQITGDSEAAAMVDRPHRAPWTI